MPLNHEHLECWLRGRLGYGDLSPGRAWFIGLEEACGTQNLNGEIEARLNGDCIEDLRDAHLRLATQIPENPSLGRLMNEGKLQQTWWPLIQLYLSSLGELSEDTNANTRKIMIRNCQMQRWGRIPGDNVVAELFPLPSPGQGAWPYANHELVLPNVQDNLHLNTRPRYYDHWWPIRRDLIRQQLATSMPRYVIAYGERDKFIELFDFAGNPDRVILDNEGRPWARIWGTIALIPHPTARPTPTIRKFIELGQHLRQRP